MVRLSVLIFCIFSLNISNLGAQTYIRDYTYKASEADSKITSRTNALDQVKLILLQEIGTHVRQKISMRKDSLGNSFASDDIEAITAGLTSVDIIEEKWTGETYYLKAKIEADTNRVMNALEEFKKNDAASQQQLATLKENQRALKAARDEIAQLRKQLSESQNKATKEKIIVQYTKQVEQVEQLSLLDNISFNGYISYKQGQYNDAVYWFRKAAEQSHVLSQSMLAGMYYNGDGIKQDYAQAAYWYRKVAKQGDAGAQALLGGMYAKGQGVKQDDVQAAHWFSKAAEQGYAPGQFLLGMLYESGRGIKQDGVQAIHWYSKAAEQGNATAQVHLAEIYAQGQGVKKDIEIAIHWLRKAAEQGHSKAQYSLGIAYAQGLGVKKDIEIAIQWIYKAAEQDNDLAKRFLTQLQNK